LEIVRENEPKQKKDSMNERRRRKKMESRPLETKLNGNKRGT
jgi:hypothetical protein